MITVKPLASALGAEIEGVDLRKPIPQEAFREVLDAWHRHLVLRFRRQPLTDPQLLVFSQLFGELDPPGPNTMGKPYIPGVPGDQRDLQREGERRPDRRPG